MVIFLIIWSLFNWNSEEPLRIDSSKVNPYFSLASFNNLQRETRDFFFNEELTAQGVIIKEFQGRTLYEKNADKQFPIASITKILSAYLTLKLFSPEEVLSFTSTSIKQPGEVGFFKVGEKLKIIDLLRASLISSSNDSIFLISETYGEEEFINLINQRLKSWGFRKTFIKDSMGLSPENVSTPSELAEIVFKIYSEFPEIFEITRQEKVIINGKTFWNTNLILPKYNKIILGGKTGYTDEAGECLILFLKFPSSPFISLVIVNSKNRFYEAETLIRSLARYYNHNL